MTAVAALVVSAILGASTAASAQPRYRATQTGDIVELQDTRAQMVVKVLTTASNAYQMTVNGEDVIRRTWASLDDIRPRMGLNGIPLLWPYANRLDEQAFYANGQKYSFDPGLGNTGRGAVPMHGFLTAATAWKVIEAKADAKSAWVTSKLEFFRIPSYMKQFPFAHTLTMTYRVQDGAMEVRTRIDSLSDAPMPVAIGFHPYFQLTDTPRDEWQVAIAAKTRWILDARKLPTGQTEPTENLLPPPRVGLREYSLDEVFSDLVRDGDGRSTMTVWGKAQRLDLVLGPRYRSVVVWAPHPSGKGRGGQGDSPPAERNFICLEPMAGIGNAINLAYRGQYAELQ
jgi:aldose 1-epimerase